jgi:predicted lactoylglutathione lyase
MRMIFVNLPVKDLAASKAFFAALGFSFNDTFSDDSCAYVVVEENIGVMLQTHAKFRDFIVGEIGDPARGTQVLNCLSADSRAEVEEFLAKALAAGAKPWKPAIDYGTMYGVSFQDLDGHVWEVMWMDPAAVADPPKEAALA